MFYGHPTPDTRRLAEPRASRGFSLIELMISMVIGLFILAGVVYVMANSRKNYETTDYTARLQDNARFALHFLGYDLRNAGFWGCSDQGIGSPPFAIQGEDPKSDPTPYNMSATFTPAQVDAGDRIVITYADPNGSLSGTQNTNGTVTVTVPANSSVVVSDCSNFEILSATTAGALTTSSAFTTTYEIRTLRRNRYYVAPSPLNNNNLVLCRQDANTTDAASPPSCSGTDKTDLVHGIEHLRVLYGLDTDGDGAPNQYGDYAAVGANWNQVVGVQLGLLVRSVSNYRPETNLNREFGSVGAGDVDNKTYNILDKNTTNGNAVDPVNLRVARRVITETIQIRNAVMDSPSA